MTIMNIKKHHRYLKGNLHYTDVLPKHTDAVVLIVFSKSFRIGVIINKEALKRRSVETLCHLSCSFSQVHSNLRRKKGSLV